MFPGPGRRRPRHGVVDEAMPHAHRLRSRPPLYRFQPRPHAPERLRFGFIATSGSAASADHAGPKIAPRARPNEGCCLSPRRRPFFYLLAKIEHLAAAQHGFRSCRVASVLLMQHEPRQESEPGPASLPSLQNDPGSGLALLGEERKHRDVTEPAVKQVEQLG